MAAPYQIQGLSAATKFIAANAGHVRLMAVVDFGGSLRIVQNFTANADVLRGGLGSEEFLRRSKCAGVGRARDGGVDGTVFLWLVTRQCRGGFWGAQYAAGGAQPGEKS